MSSPVLDLTAVDPALDTFQQRFIDDSLPAELRRAGFARFDRSAYRSEDLRWGLQAWQLRTLDEYRSQVAFTELLVELTQLGCSFDVLGTCVRIVRDESRHVELCRRMVRALGGEDAIPGEPNWVRANPDLPPLARVFETTVSALCVGETLSAALLAALRDATPDPLARAVLTVLVADESIHAQFGWHLLGLLLPAVSDADRQRVAAKVPELLSLAKEAAGAGPDDSRFENPFGHLSASERDGVYRDVLQRKLQPRFAELCLV